MFELQNKIIHTVENLSGHKVTEFSRWERKPYLADGSIVSEFWDLIEEATAVLLIGDYDVDGICAVFIIATAIHNVFPDKPIRIRIPRRFSEGYGIHDQIIDEIRQKDPAGTLIITADNGINEKYKLEKLEQEGYKVAITDHHEAKELPRVSFVINPVMENMDIPLCGNFWCGAGVALKLIEQYVDEETKSAAEVLAAIATIADCVPLVEGNWVLVKKALKRIRAKKAPFQISALIDEMGQDIRYCNENTIGFYVAPALNAPGRLYDKGGAMVLSYLLSPNLTKAREIVSINNRRKQLRDEQYDVVRYKIREEHLSDRCPIWIAIPGLHEGIIGILAGRIVEDYGVPAIVLTMKEDGTFKGSARTTEDINIYEYLSSLDVVFISLGGHQGAAGMTISKEELDKARLSELPHPPIKDKMKEYIQINMGDIPAAEKEIAKYSPYGECNPAPMFSVLVDMQSDMVRMAGRSEEHLIIEDRKGEWQVTHFHHNPNNLEDKERFYVAGTIEMRSFNGTSTPALNGAVAYDMTEGKEMNDLIMENIQQTEI